MTQSSILASAPELRGTIDVDAQDLRLLLDHAAEHVDPAVVARVRPRLERRAELQAERLAAAEREREVLRAAGYTQRERDLWSLKDGDFRIDGMRRSLFEHHLQAKACTHVPGERVCEVCSYLPRDHRAVA